MHFALRHGVPVVVAGMTEDKAEVAARVAWSGAGLNRRTNQPTPERVAGAAHQVLTDSTLRASASASARRLGAEIDSAPGMQVVVERRECLRTGAQCLNPLIACRSGPGEAREVAGCRCGR